jgi:sulfur-oxidizing protein SoxA
MKSIRIIALVLLTAVGWAHADSSEDSIAQYREMLADDNPADLWQTKGEEFWKTRRGPKQASLEGCDLGLGAGVVKGAYAQLPRYFADTGRVQDLESRLVTCMVTLQGLSKNDAEKDHFSSDGRSSNMEALSAWISAQSSGLPMAARQSHPTEKEAYAVGEKLFFYRAGPHDFACSTCHSTSGVRVRLQAVANLTEPAEAQKIYTTWPAYRVSQGTVRTMENRLYDCLRQQRMPIPTYTSDAITDLTVYLAVQAKGGLMSAPGIKR